MRKYSNVLFLSVVWAIYYVTAGISNKSINPLMTGIIVRLITCVLLTTVMLCKGSLKQLLQVRKVFPLLLCVGVFGFLLDITAFMGLRFSSSATGTVLLKTDVIMVNCASAWIYGTRFTKKDWILTGTMLMGVLIILRINPFNMHFSLSDIFFLLSAAFVTANAFLIKHIQTLKQVTVSNDVIAYYNNFVTLIIFTLSSLVMGVWEGPIFPANRGTLGIVLIICGFGQSFIYYFYYKSLRTLPVWIVKVVLLLVPVFSLIIELLFLNKTFGASHLLGSLIVLISAAGLIMEQSRKEKNKASLMNRLGSEMI